MFAKGVQQKAWEANRGRKHTEEWRQKMREWALKTGCVPPHFTGEKHYNWKGGIASDRKKYYLMNRKEVILRATIWAEKHKEHRKKYLKKL